MELSLAIPFYNEEKNVANVLRELSSLLAKNAIDYEVIAVDNGSHDITGSIIDGFSRKNPRIRKVRVEVNQGYGYGIKKGLDECRGNFVGYLWGDNQIPPFTVIDLLKKLKNEGLSLCKVTRIQRTESRVRRIQSMCYNFLMWILFGVRSHDVNGCPKIMRRDVYKSLRIQSNDWFIDAEILIQCKRKGYKLGEIPIESQEREGGTSKVNWRTCFEFMRNMVRYKFAHGCKSR